MFSTLLTQITVSSCVLLAGCNYSGCVSVYRCCGPCHHICQRVSVIMIIWHAPHIRNLKCKQQNLFLWLANSDTGSVWPHSTHIKHLPVHVPSSILKQQA